MCGTCDQGWRVEAADAFLGLTRTVLHPMSIDAETVLANLGQATLTLPDAGPYAVGPRDVLPRLVHIYITDPVGEITAWVIDQTEYALGSVTVGLLPVEEWTDHWIIRPLVAPPAANTKTLVPGSAKEPRRYDNKTLTHIAYDLVRSGYTDTRTSNGDPVLIDTLLAKDGGSAFTNNDRTYEWWERTTVWQALELLAGNENPVEWSVSTVRTVQGYRTTMTFKDRVGIVHSEPVRKQHLAGWRVVLNGSELTNVGWAMGEGQERDQLVVVATDKTKGWPLSERAESFSNTGDTEQTGQQVSTVASYAEGMVETDATPRTTVEVSVRADLYGRHDLGDVFPLDLGVWCKGPMRVVKKTVRVSLEATETSLGVIPETNDITDWLQGLNEECVGCG